MRTAIHFRSFVLAAFFALFAQVARAQCPDIGTALTPTVRALLMLEKPATLTEEQWTKVFENPANRNAFGVIVYEEDRFDPCDLPRGWWYVMMAGRRPEAKQVVLIR